MEDEPTVYDDLGIPQVINAAGTKTRIGGSLIRSEAMEAMSKAAESFVRISDLQARASDLLQEVTGAEAGYVASGAAASMTLGIAACIAGDDLRIMDQLPDTEGVADEVVMPKSHRNGYDHAIRGAGATIVDVGNSDNTIGTGSKNTELWEIENGITEDTVALSYLEKSYTQPPLPDVVEVAHDHNVPVLVDAAAELPPKSNLERFINMGADLVVFSGGKAIRGPQTTGLLVGRKDLVESAAIQHLDMHVAEEVWEPPADLIDIDRFGGVPRHGIGRPFKTGKEELVGIIRALELFVEQDTEEIKQTWRIRASQIAESLDRASTLNTEIQSAGETNVAPTVMVSVNSDAASTDAETIIHKLRQENPRIFVGPDYIKDDAFTVNPMCLTDNEADYVVDRLLDVSQ